MAARMGALISAAALAVLLAGCGTSGGGDTGTISLAGPNGGEAWNIGSSYDITWTASGIGSVRLQISRDGRMTWTEIVASVDAAAGTYSWTVAGPPSGNCFIRVSDASDGWPYDVSDVAFTIPGLEVTSPNGGETWDIGWPQTVTWASGGVANVRIELSRDGGTNWAEIVASTNATTGSYTSDATGPASTNCLVRVSDTGAGGFSDVSDAAFEVATTSLALTAPVGGEAWRIGSSQNVTWTSLGVADVRLQVSRNSGASWTDIVASTPAAAGTYSWTVAGPGSEHCLVRISDAADGVPYGVSAGEFAIPSISVTSPAAAATWSVGETATVAWTSIGPIYNVKIELSTDGGTTWLTLDASTANNGSASFNVTGGSSTTCVVRVSDVGGTASGISGTFRIVAPTVTVTSPDGGEAHTAQTNSRRTNEWLVRVRSSPVRGGIRMLERMPS